MFPLAALIAHEDLDVADDVSLGHYTHEKSSVGCAAGLATLDVVEDEKLLERSRRLGMLLVERLNELKQRYPIILEVRGFGMLIGVELRAAYQAEAIMYAALDRGLSFKVSSGTVLTLTPPLTISEEEIEAALLALEGAFQTVKGS